MSVGDLVFGTIAVRSMMNNRRYRLGDTQNRCSSIRVLRSHQNQPAMAQ